MIDHHFVAAALAAFLVFLLAGGALIWQAVNNARRRRQAEIAERARRKWDAARGIERTMLLSLREMAGASLTLTRD